MSDMTNKPLLTTRKIKVNTYDIDFAGVVSNIVYVRWMEDMRIAMTEPPHNLALVSLMDGGDGDGGGIAPAVLETKINYRRAIRLGDKVTGTVWITNLTSRKIEGCFEFHVGNKIAATGSQTGCFINLRTMKFARTPQQWLDVYENCR